MRLFSIQEQIMKTRLIATLLTSLLAAGTAYAQQGGSHDSHGTHSSSQASEAPGKGLVDGAATTEKRGPKGTSRHDSTPSVSRQHSASGSPGATNGSDRMSGASGTSSSGATGTSQGAAGMESGNSRQIGTGNKSSGTAGSAGGSGGSSAAGSGGMGGGATGGTMR
jgi:hypothetical protein